MNINNLLDDVVLEIFSLLDGPSLIKCRNVNHRWRMLIDLNPKIYKHITLKLEPGEILDENFQNHRDLRYERIQATRFCDLHMRVYKSSDTKASEIFEFHKCTIKDAIFERTNWNFLAEHVEKFENLQRLELITIQNLPLTSPVLKLTNLKVLRVFDTHDKFTVIAPNLEKLAVQWGLLSNEMLENFLNLKRLEIVEANWKKQKGKIISFPQNLVSLKIELAENSELEVDFIQVLKENKKSLKELQILTENHQNEVEFAIYEMLIEKLTVKLPKKFEFMQKTNENIKTLNLHSSLNNWHFSSVFHSCPKVENLTIENQKGDLYCEVLLAAVHLLPNLKSLCIKKCQISEFDEIFDLHSIESLTLEPVEIELESYMSSILSCGNLKKLQLNRPYYAETLSSENLIKILKTLKHLQNWSANCVVELSNEFIDFIIENDLKLRTLNLVVFEDNFESQKELSIRLSRSTNIQCIITEVTERELNDGM